MKRTFIAFLLTLLVASILHAQGTSGKLSGTVSGPDGLLPGATVTARDNGTGKEVTVTTNEDGAYQFAQLEFGTYTIRITAPGFKTLVGNDQKVDVGREANFNASLEVGAVSAEVVVTAGADVLTTNTAQVSNTVSAQQILSLPLITRSPLALTTLQAGTSTNGATSINGMRTSMTNITRDGINIQDTFIRTNATDFAPGRPSVDDTAEFTITTSNQEADQGYGGAQIRLVTPRGTKDLHGALFAYNRNSALGANNFFNNRSSNPDTAKKPPYRNRNQFGGKVSGPLWLPHFGEGGSYLLKNKAVFFFAYEGIRDPVTAASTRTILTPSARAGAFTYQRTNSTDVTPFCPSQAIGSTCVIPNILSYARTSLAGGASIPTAIDPLVQARIINALPTTSNFTGGDTFNTAGYRLIRRSDQTRNQYASRVDIDVSDRDAIQVIYNYNKEVNLRPDADTEAYGVVPDVSQLSDNKQFTAAYRRVFTSNFINEFRGGFLKSSVPFDTTNDQGAYHLVGTLVGSPTNTFMDQGRNTNAINLQSNADWIRNNHTFRFGGQLQYFKVDAYNDAGILPTVSLGTNVNTPTFATTNFNGIGGIGTSALGTANGLLALLGGIVSQSTQTFNVADLQSGFKPTSLVQPFRHAAHSLYFADRWQATPNLTLSLGVRWELYPALKLKGGLALEPLIENADDPLPSLLRQNGSYVPIGANSGDPESYYKTQYDNFAPNFGVAYTPRFESGVGKFLFGDRSVIRAGYSHVFGNDSIITSINNAAAGNQGLAGTASTISNQNGRLSTGSFALPTTPTFIPPPRTYLQNNAANVNFFGTVFAVDPNIEVSRVKQWSVGIQREFFGNLALEVRYVGTSSNNLVRSIDYNQIDIRNNGFAADFNRALNNVTLCDARNVAVANSCTTGANFNAAIPGSVALQVFPLLGANALLTNATILGLIRGGTPADLALTYIQNNLNNHPTVASPTNVPFIKFLPNPASGVVNILTNGAEYTYNSLQVETRRRFSNGLYFQANYTFSKNLTNGIGTSQNLVEPFLDNANPQWENARADFDQTHAFNFNGVYQLPIGRGRAFLGDTNSVIDSIFGGWELSGIVQWNTGVPITFTDARGTLNRAGRAGRQTPNSSLTAEQIKGLTGIFEKDGKIYFLDPSIIASSGRAANGFGSTPFAGQVFFNVNPGETGNLPRSLFNAPSFFNVNAAMLKNFKFTENTRLQIRAEAFNLLNNVNFFPNAQFSSVNSTTFGQITSAGAARTIQLAARLEW